EQIDTAMWTQVFGTLKNIPDEFGLTICSGTLRALSYLVLPAVVEEQGTLLGTESPRLSAEPVRDVTSYDNDRFVRGDCLGALRTDPPLHHCALHSNLSIIRIQGVQCLPGRPLRRLPASPAVLEEFARRVDDAPPPARIIQRRRDRCDLHALTTDSGAGLVAGSRNPDVQSRPVDWSVDRAVDGSWITTLGECFQAAASACCSETGCSGDGAVDPLSLDRLVKGVFNRRGSNAFLRCGRRPAGRLGARHRGATATKVRVLPRAGCRSGHCSPWWPKRRSLET